MTYRLIQQLQQKAIPVTHACRVLEVSRAGFYQHHQRGPRQAEVAATVELKAVFAASGQAYGSRRLVRALQAQGRAIGRYRVRRLMREAALRPVWKRKFVHTTDSKHDLPVAENLLNRQFEVAMPNQAWTSDITYVRTRQGCLSPSSAMAYMPISSHQNFSSKRRRSSSAASDSMLAYVSSPSMRASRAAPCLAA